MADTLPSEDSNDYAVQLAPSVGDASGALWLHKDYVQVVQPWANEAHIGPPKASEAFGDVESWAVYVKRYGGADSGAGQAADVLLTWNSEGLKAVLDYHSDTSTAGRLWWTVRHPFERSAEWKAWMALADGHAKGQREAIEALEDRGNDVVEPAPADLMNLLRTLRVTVNKSAQTELRPDGTTNVQYTDDKGIAARGGTVDLPSEITIAIPVLKGHVDADGKPVVYGLKVRLRATVNDQARLALRFTIPNADRALEEVFADRVSAARTALGDGYAILRAAG
jgi:hypothetical protein